MEIVSMIITVLGLCLFETISSIDNAIINADVLSTMKGGPASGFFYGACSSQSLSYGAFFPGLLCG